MIMKRRTILNDFKTQEVDGTFLPGYPLKTKVSANESWIVSNHMSLAILVLLFWDYCMTEEIKQMQNYVDVLENGDLGHKKKKVQI